jgi:hypothetical protein
MTRDIGRAARLGKYIAKSIKQYTSSEFQEAVQKSSYKRTIKRILSEDFKPRKKGDPSPNRNKSALESIPYETFNIANPKHYAALLIERGHFNYSANTANRIRKSLLENL